MPRIAATALNPDGAGQGEFRQGWKPLLAASVGIGLGMSPLPTFTAGAFAVALEQEFGWARGEILAANMLQTLSLFIIGPLLGRLADRIGARPVAIASIIGLGLSTAAFSLITANIWTYYAIYAVMSVVSLGTMPTIFARVVSLWFDKRRGMALGLALSTTGIAGILLPIYVQMLIGSVGWREAYIGVGLLPLVIALPVVLLLMPKGQGPAADEAKAEGPTIVDDGMSIGEALRTYRYWLMAVLALAAGAGLSGILINLIPLLVDKGFSPAEAARMFGLYGLFVILGRLLSGWLLDRFWAPAVGCAFLAAPAVGAALLTGEASMVGVLATAVILLALASGAEFDLVAFLTARYFGRRNFSALYSGQYAFFGLGAGVAPAIFGRVHDVTGSYDAVLHVSSALFAGSALAILALGRYPQSDSDLSG